MKAKTRQTKYIDHAPNMNQPGEFSACQYRLSLCWFTVKFKREETAGPAAIPRAPLKIKTGALVHSVKYRNKNKRADTLDLPAVTKAAEAAVRVSLENVSAM